MKNAKNSLKALMILFAGAALIGCATTQTEEPAPTPKPKAETAPAPKEGELGPAVEEKKAAPPPTTMAYTVVRGDHLWGISAKPAIYGNPYQWPLIYKANRDKIKDADLIYPGQVFTIEKNPAQGEIDAAVKHAKTRGAWSLGVVEESDKAYLAR